MSIAVRRRETGHITVMLGLLFAPILIVYYILDGERRRRTDPEFTHVGIQAHSLVGCVYASGSKSVCVFHSNVPMFA